MGPVAVEWSLDALADLDRFAAFLREHHPDLASRVAGELIAGTGVLARHPLLGRALRPRVEYRELVLQVLGAPYRVQYRFDGQTVLMLRVFHGREVR